MADADDSYDFSQLDAFVEALRAGNTMVIGNRFRGGIRPGAMPFLHRYLWQSAAQLHRSAVLFLRYRRLSLRPARR